MIGARDLRHSCIDFILWLQRVGVPWTGAPLPAAEAA
jgi:hypothetical protein